VAAEGTPAATLAAVSLGVAVVAVAWLLVAVGLHRQA
jgi:hypothetical protein